MDMKDAYDLKELGEEMKAEGLDLLEDGAGKAYKALKSWLKKSAVKSTTPVDNIVTSFLDQLDSAVLPQIDKIDGEVG